MVATYRSTDTDPKERFVHQQAGAGGYGNSSYIDLIAFREKDANTSWTTASDGVLEERLYYCQNQHADVVALITAAGGQREMDRYSAYGVPFGLPTGDCNSNGVCDVNDRNQVQTWINASNHYDVRGDLDLDGDVDSTDKTTLRNNYEGVALGHLALSAASLNNTRGNAGYQRSPEQGMCLYLVRHRYLHAAVGSWASFDPLESVDATSRYMYCHSQPICLNDETGLAEELIELTTNELGIPGTLDKYQLDPNADSADQLSASEVVRVHPTGTAVITPRQQVIDEIMDLINCCSTPHKEVLRISDFNTQCPPSKIKRSKNPPRFFGVKVDRKKVCTGDPCPTCDTADLIYSGALVNTN